MDPVNSADLNLWVNCDMFVYGILPYSPSVQCITEHLKRVVTYCKTKGAAGFPSLSYDVWMHLACDKFSLHPSLAWMYFQLASLTSFPVSNHQTTTKEWIEKLTEMDVPPPSTSEEVKRYSINTLEFIVFLFIQRVCLTSSLSNIKATIHMEEWPNSSRPAAWNGSLERRMPASESRYVDFIKEHVEELVTVLQSDVGEINNRDFISVDIVQALGLIIKASSITNPSKEKMFKDVTIPLHIVASMPKFSEVNGYDSVKKQWKRGLFLPWLIKSLVCSPYGVLACASHGKRLRWLVGSSSSSNQSLRSNRIATTGHSTPDSLRKILVSQIQEQLLAPKSETLNGSDVRVHRAHKSNIFLLKNLRSLYVYKSHDSHIVAGSVGSILMVEGCRNLTVTATCRQIIIHRCTNCKFFLLTPRRPLLMGRYNTNVVLAPYNTTYPLLEAHLLHGGLSVDKNLWDSPLLAGDFDESEKAKIYNIMPPLEFHMFTIPFNMEGPTYRSPYELPSEYRKVIEEKKKVLPQWKAVVESHHLSPSQNEILSELIVQRFQSWILEQGKDADLKQLMFLEKAVPLSKRKSCEKTFSTELTIEFEEEEINERVRKRVLELFSDPMSTGEGPSSLTWKSLSDIKL